MTHEIKITLPYLTVSNQRYWVPKSWIPVITKVKYSVELRKVRAATFESWRCGGGWGG